jgi:hypothetical protein
MDGDADDAEGKQQQPHDGIEDQREQGHGPANYEKKTPKQERDHGVVLLVKIRKAIIKVRPWYPLLENREKRGSRLNAR